jgi:hypothetical protein
MSKSESDFSILLYKKNGERKFLPQLFRISNRCFTSNGPDLQNFHQGITN